MIYTALFRIFDTFGPKTDDFSLPVYQTTEQSESSVRHPHSYFKQPRQHRTNETTFSRWFFSDSLYRVNRAGHDFNR